MGRIRKAGISVLLFAALFCLSVISAFPWKDSPVQAAEAGSGTKESVGVSQTLEADRAPMVYYSGQTWLMPGDIVQIQGAGLRSLTSVRLQLLKTSQESAEENGTTAPDSGELQTLLDESASIQSSGKSAWNRSGSYYELELLQNTDSSVKVAVPSQLPSGQYLVCLKNKAGETYLVLNAPSIQWMQGDNGESASPGGWIRIQGTHLSLGKDGQQANPEEAEQQETGREEAEQQAVGSAFAIVTDSAGNTAAYPLDEINENSVSLSVPETMAEGMYTVSVCNGFGPVFSNTQTIRIEAPVRDSWATEVFNVMDYATDTADGSTYLDYAFHAAIDAAEANGGGIVYIPQGRYPLRDSYEIPDKVVIRGESAEKALLFWMPYEWTAGNLPESVLRARGAVILENLTISGGRIGNLLTASGERTIVQNCRFHFYSMSGYATANDTPGNLNAQALINLEMGEDNSDILRISGKNVTITDCQILSSGRPFVLDGASYIYMSNVVFPVSSHEERNASARWVENVIFENLEFQSTGVELSGSKLYVADSSWDNNQGGMRETLVIGEETADVLRGSFDAKSLTLTRNRGEETQANDLEKETHTTGLEESESGSESRRYEGMAVYALTGPAKGESRRIVSWDTPDTLILESAFTAVPDADTLYAVGYEQDSIYLNGLDVYSSGTIAFRGLNSRTILANSTFRLFSGVLSYDGEVTEEVRTDAGNTGAAAEMTESLDAGTTSLNWYLSIVDNHILDSNWMRAYGLDSENRCTILDIISDGMPSSMLGILVRENVLEHGAFVSVASANADGMENVLLQGNTLTGNAKIALTAADGAADAILCAANTFEKEGNTYRYSEELLTAVNEYGEPRAAFLSVIPDAEAASGRMPVLIAAGSTAALLVLAGGIAVFCRRKKKNTH